MNELNPSESSPQIRIAESREEYERIFHLRYQIHVDEMGKSIQNADHHHKWLTDKLDKKAILFYAEKDGDVIATMRLNLGRDGIPEQLRDDYSLDLFEQFGKEALSFSSRLVVKPEWRGHMVLARMICKSYTYGRENGLRLNFCNCAPSLLQFYYYMGYRRFKKNILDSDVGYRIPVILLIEDEAHLRNVRSPFAPLCKRYENSPETATWFKEKFSEYECFYNKRVEDTDDFWNFVDNRLHDDDVTLLRDLTPEELKQFIASATILTCDAGDKIIREGDVGNEMFVVLSGAAEVRKKINGTEYSIGVCGTGDVFGEMSFLSKKPRSADVIAMTNLEILVLNSTFLTKLKNSIPKIAAKILYNLAVILCDRVRASSRNWIVALSTEEQNTSEGDFLNDE